MEGVAVNPQFWKNKKVFITGHTGFKGSWLSLWLQSLGANVIGYALDPPSDPSLFIVANIENGMTSIHGDIRDTEQMVHAITVHRPEIIIHMAAQSLVRYSYHYPVETYTTNVLGTVNVLEAARQTLGVKAVIIVTSDKCYENREWDWGYRENDPMGGYDPYSNSKGCAELVTSAYRHSFFDTASCTAAVATVRAGNVIGGGDWAEDRLMTDMIRAISKGQPVLIRSPHAVRPWQHTLEPLSGYLLLAEHLYEEGNSYAEGWNFGPRDDDAREVQWIVERVTSLWGEGATWIKDNGDHPHEANYLKLDCSKARSRLQWQPHLNLSQALEKTVLWYKAFFNGENMREITLNQIYDYQGALRR